MEKYPYLNEAIAHVLSRRRAEPSMNVVFYLSEALDMKPDVFVREVMEEIECFKSKERERTHGIRR